MTTEVLIGGSAIQYRDWSITVPTSSVDVAPSASVTTTATASVSANDTLTIEIDGTPVFEGRTRSAGTKSELGGRQLDAAHPARDLFEDTVSLSLVTPTTEEVLSAAIDAASTTGFALDYTGSAVSLSNDYNVEDRSVKRIFRDIMDRTGRVWWVDPAGSTIHVQPRGGRGQWQAIDTQADKASLTKFDEGSVDSVRNAVTVVGTGDEAVRATAEDSTSISTYGRRPGNSPYNVSYVTTQNEAQAYADALLTPQPLPSGTLLVGQNTGDVTQPLANYTVAVTDQGKDVDASGLIIESQTIQQGRAELEIGAGSGVSREEVNRQSKSNSDNSEPGSVYNSDRIADDAVTTSKLVDDAVIASKLQDLSVTLNKVDFDAIDETKIQDDAVRTPQLFAGAVTAEKIAADTITANEIAAGTITALEIAADTITANQIAANTITAGQIDALDLSADSLSITRGGEGFAFEVTTGDQAVAETVAMTPVTDEGANIGTDTKRFVGEFSDLTADTLFMRSGGGQLIRPANDNAGSVGSSTFSFSEMWAYDFFDADSGTALSDGGNPLAGLTDGSGPPDFVTEERETEDGDTVSGVSVSKLARWLMDVCREQQRVVEEQGERIDSLEERLSRLEEQV